MMSLSELPISFCGYALYSALLILNKVPSKSVEQTPYEIWTGKKPGFSFLKIWGCWAYVKRLDSTKLEPKSDKCLFVGYPRETKGYYFYNPQENKTFVDLHAIFLEKEFLKAVVSGRKVELDENRSDTVPGTDPPTEHEQSIRDMIVPQSSNTQGPRMSKRVRKQPKRYGFPISPHVDINLIEENEPATYEEAVQGTDSALWKRSHEVRNGFHVYQPSLDIG